MAVQARHFSHVLAPAVGGSLFLDDYAAGCVPAPARIAGDAITTLLGDFPRNDLTWCNYGFVLPRKRPRVEAAADHHAAAAPLPGGDLFLEDQGAATSPPPTGTERLLPVPPPFVDVRSRAMGSGAASTSGRVANAATTTVVDVDYSRQLLSSSWTHHQHGVEIDALVALEAERMRASLEEARRRHARALLAAASRAASRRLRASETDLERALRRNAELEEKARQAGADCHAWMGVARSHDAVAAGLRAALDQLLLLQQQSGARAPAGSGGEGEAEAEDARSCCFEAVAESGGGACASRSRLVACKACGGVDACVLLLPCRHLCLCPVCEAAVDACPVCATNKNGSLHVLFS